MAAPVIRLSATAFTHRGAVRPANEDTIAIADWVTSDSMPEPVTLTRDIGEPTVCLVADGLGGHTAGEVASRRVAEALARRAAEAADEGAVAAVLRDADAELFALMRGRPELLGMGSTVAGVGVGPSSRVVVFNLGDSRVYRIDEGGGSLVQLSTDDTPGPKLPDGRTAAITTSQITQCLGGGYEPAGIAPHVLAEPLGDKVTRYLICSDGLTDPLPLRALEARLGPDDRTTVEALFEAAMAAGGPDNISLILLRLTPDRPEGAQGGTSRGR